MKKLTTMEYIAHSYANAFGIESIQGYQPDVDIGGNGTTTNCHADGKRCRPSHMPHSVAHPVSTT